MEIKKITPLYDRVLVEPVEQGEKRQGSLLIADLGEDSAKIGKVIAVGPGRKSEFGIDIPVTVKVGQYVVLPKIGAQRIEVEDKEYWILQEKEIMSIVEY